MPSRLVQLLGVEGDLLDVLLVSCCGVVTRAEVWHRELRLELLRAEQRWLLRHLHDFLQVPVALRELFQQVTVT